MMLNFGGKLLSFAECDTRDIEKSKINVAGLMLSHSQNFSGVKIAFKAKPAPSESERFNDSI